MRLAWVVVLSAACKSKQPPPPAPPPKAVTAPATQTAWLVTCAPAKIAPRVRPATTADAPKPRGHVADVKVWTPYAAGEGMAPDDIAGVAAQDLTKEIRARLGKIDACFGGHTGSLRAMLTVAFDGGVISARVGGVGDHDVDACVAGALVGLKVSAPPIISEVSCDFVRGDPAPWRLTLDGRYEVIDLTKDAPPVGEIADASAHTYAIVAGPDVPAEALARALAAVRWSQGTLVAVRRDAGAPTFIGMGHDARTGTFGDGEPIAIDLQGAPHPCADRAPLVPAAPPLAVLKNHCASAPCGTLTVAFGTAGNAGDIAAQALDAANDGYRVLVGGDGCAQPSSTASSVSISGGSGSSADGGSAPSSASPSSR